MERAKNLKDAILKAKSGDFLCENLEPQFLRKKSQVLRNQR